MKNIEDKAQIPNPEEIPAKIQADCDMCNENTTFEYVYTQSFPGKNDVYVYGCIKCSKMPRNTKSYQTLMNKFNGRVID